MTGAAAAPADGGQALAAYARLRRRRLLLILLLAAAVACVFLLDLGTGPAGIPPLDALGSLTGLSTLPPAQEVILWQLRLPVALMAVLVGASLALAGAEMQTVLANPLAELFTLGVSNPALGAALAIVAGLGASYRPTDRRRQRLPARGRLAARDPASRARQRRRHRDAGLFGIALGFGQRGSVARPHGLADAAADRLLGMGSLARAD